MSITALFVPHSKQRKEVASKKIWMMDSRVIIGGYRWVKAMVSCGFYPIRAANAWLNHLLQKGTPFRTGCSRLALSLKTRIFLRVSYLR